jgi:hypothetical protein
MTTNRAKRKNRTRKSAVGEALTESLTEAVAWANGETELPVREVQPPAQCEVVRLSAEDQRCVAEAILKPPAPAPTLRRAAQRVLGLLLKGVQHVNPAADLHRNTAR